MTRPVRIDEEAADELADAARWYERHRRGLGRELVAAVRRAFAAISENPQAWSLAPGVSPDFDVRRLPLHRFPFAVVYLELEDEIRILALAHGSREPGYWRRRL